MTSAQAQKAVGFKVQQPTHLPQGIKNSDLHYNVLKGQNGTFTFNADKARAQLQKNGEGNVQIPAQLDGAKFTITTQAGVAINNSTVCSTSSGDKNKGQNEKTQINNCASHMFMVVELPSPSIKATGKASLSDLRDFLLSLPKLSQQTRDLIQKVDIEHGVLPLPIPQQLSSQQVTVHQTSGTLIADDSVKMGGVVWQSNGIIYAVGGSSTNTTEIIDVANSLK